MKARPILFSTPMVQAILAGRKTQTRRIFKVNKTPITHQQEVVFWDVEMGEAVYNSMGGQSWWNCPYGNIGDILYVKETFLYRAKKTAVIYKADLEALESFGFGAMYGGWKPSIHMPKSAARIFLKITNVRVERLQDISAADIKKEGVSYTIDYYTALLDLWESLWKSINGEQSWNDNPYVWVVEFERIDKPENF